MSRQIAIIEDEQHIAENYRDTFSKHGFKVTLYSDKAKALAGLADRLPDLVIIDIGLGDDHEAGFEICQSLRARSKTLPIVFLTARDNEIDEISGFRLGADDYMSKDIKLHHVIARVNALFRRVAAYKSLNDSDAEIVNGDVRINKDRMSVSWQDQVIDLSVTEFWIVKALAGRPGHVKSKDALMKAANVVCEDNTITSHIRRIRTKFKAVDPGFKQIETMHMAGYRWRTH